MSTLLEMAAVIRAEAGARSSLATTREVPRACAAAVDLRVPGKIDYWCKLLGTTPLRLYRAVDEVGSDPTVIRRFLARQSQAATPARLAPRGA
jgi:hypothetical protein